jgi:uridine phosphorylase
MSATTSAVYSNTNGFPMSNGKNLHMDLGRGDLHNRVITVGSVQRAEKIASFLDTTSQKITSSRGFTTINGLFNGIPVSIVSIGMGISMMDFFVRESRAIVDGPMAMVRFGTCGGVSNEANAGKIVVASYGSGYIHRNVDYFAYNYSNDISRSTSLEPYITSQISPADEELSALVSNELKKIINDEDIIEGCNVTADSFYSSQGRIDDNFNDYNHSIIDIIKEKYPSASSMEMETFNLLHLAKCSRIQIKASAAAIVVANRISGNVIDGNLLDALEEKGGKAILIAITNIEL